MGKTFLGWGRRSASIHLAYIIYKNIHIQSHVESKGSMSQLANGLKVLC